MEPSDKLTGMLQFLGMVMQMPHWDTPMQHAHTALSYPCRRRWQGFCNGEQRGSRRGTS